MSAIRHAVVVVKWRVWIAHTGGMQDGANKGLIRLFQSSSVVHVRVLGLTCLKHFKREMVLRFRLRALPYVLRFKKSR